MAIRPPMRRPNFDADSPPAGGGASARGLPQAPARPKRRGPLDAAPGRTRGLGPPGVRFVRIFKNSLPGGLGNRVAENTLDLET